MTRKTAPATEPKKPATPKKREAGTTAPRSKGGRPSSYKAEYAQQVAKLCRLGATDKEIAAFFEVHEDTINEWKKVHPEFSESLKEGKAAADAEVADKLFKRATGYEHKAVKIVADAKTGAEHQVEYIERYPPDTTAAIFWLKNRRPDLWREKVTQEHVGENGGPIRSRIAVEFVRPPARSEDDES